MTKLQDSPAYYVDISNTERPLVKSIILDEQGNEIQHQLSDFAENITVEIQEFMDLAERLLKRSMD
jgi:hypothetical protein